MCVKTYIISFCTHAVSALYGDSVGPDGFNYISYIFLITPLQNAILNPIGIFCMEYALQKATHKGRHLSVSWKTLLCKTVWNVIVNPIFNMTMLGIVINVVVSKAIHGNDSDYNSEDNLKKWMKQFLALLGSAYYALALIYIGICMCGKMKSLNVVITLKILLLCFVKLSVNTFIQYC